MSSFFIQKLYLGSVTLDVEFLLTCLVVIFSVCCDQISDKKELKGRELQCDP